MSMIAAVTAINPLRYEIEPAILIEDHFGPGRHAVTFPSMGFINRPHFSADEAPYEPAGQLHERSQS